MSRWPLALFVTYLSFFSSLVRRWPHYAPRSYHPRCVALDFPAFPAPARLAFKACAVCAPPPPGCFGCSALRVLTRALSCASVPWRALCRSFSLAFPPPGLLRAYALLAPPPIPFGSLAAARSLHFGCSFAPGRRISLLLSCFHMQPFLLVRPSLPRPVRIVIVKCRISTLPHGPSPPQRLQAVPPLLALPPPAPPGTCCFGVALVAPLFLALRCPSLRCSAGGLLVKFFPLLSYSVVFSFLACMSSRRGFAPPFLPILASLFRLSSLLTLGRPRLFLRWLPLARPPSPAFPHGSLVLPLRLPAILFWLLTPRLVLSFQFAAPPARLELRRLPTLGSCRLRLGPRAVSFLCRRFCCFPLCFCLRLLPMALRLLLPPFSGLCASRAPSCPGPASPGALPSWDSLRFLPRLRAGPFPAGTLTASR